VGLPLRAPGRRRPPRCPTAVFPCTLRAILLQVYEHRSTGISSLVDHDLSGLWLDWRGDGPLYAFKSSKIAIESQDRCVMFHCQRG
jgi:hypothetical protein